MDLTIHQQVLIIVFALALALGAIGQKTRFCTMGAVSDWVNMGHTGRMRSWVFAMAIALSGVVLLEVTGLVKLGTDTFPPYRTPQFAWLRYLLGGLMFGIGMTLASGCGNRTLVRIGAGNVKSAVVLGVAATGAYMMLWTPLYEKVFAPWIQATTINLAQHGMPTQELGSIVARMAGIEADRGVNLAVGSIVAALMLVWVLMSSQFRESFDNVLGGAAVGLVVVAAWYVTGGPMGIAWKDYAEMSIDIPSRVATQSFTFISPMGDGLRYLADPTKVLLINFGVVALFGVILGAFLYAIATRDFRYERFVSLSDLANHVYGGALMGIGGVLAMGCTIGQAVTGMSTLAAGSLLTFISIVAGSAATMKYQYWSMTQEA